MLVLFNKVATPPATQPQTAFWHFGWHVTDVRATLERYLMDHFAVSVGDLDAWIAKLKGENVTFLEQPYAIGGFRALMIEGPSKEAIEIIGVRP